MPVALTVAVAGAACGSVSSSEPDAGESSPPDAEPSQPDADAAPGGNGEPTIANITLNPTPVEVGGETSVTCDASDPDGDELVYTWQVDLGAIDADGSSGTWSGVEAEGTATVTCIVDDQSGGTAELDREIEVAVAPDDLVAHYPFDGSGQDASGNEHHVGSINGPVFTEDRLGNAEAALSFDRQDDVVTLPDENAFDLSSFTAMAWVNYPAEKANQTILSKGSSNAGNYTLRIHAFDVQPFGATQYLHATATGTFQTGGGNQGSDMWIHLAVSVDAPNVVFYVNGVEEGTATNAPAPTLNDAEVTLGKSATGEFFGGAMDDVRIYDGALTQEQIQAIVQGD